MMKVPAWRVLGIRGALSFLWIVLVSCAYDRIGAFQSDHNGNRSLDFHSRSHGSLNNSIFNACATCDRDGSCKHFQISVNCLENGCCARGHVVEARNFKGREDQEAAVDAPDNEVADPDSLTEANGKLRRPRSHSHWIAHFVPIISVVLLVVTAVAVAICCYVHVTRPDLFESENNHAQNIL